MDRYIEAVIINDTFINDTEQHFFYFIAPDFAEDKTINGSVSHFCEELCAIFKELYQVEKTNFHYYWTDITKEEYNKHTGGTI